MNVGELRNAIENLPNDMPVFFRRVAPVAGNIEKAGSANKDTFSSFGVVQDCLIIEPITDDEDGEAQQTRVPDVCPVCGGDGFQSSGVRGQRQCAACDGTGQRG